MVSVFGRRADVEGPDGYVFFAADSAAPRTTSWSRTSSTRRCTSASSTSRTTRSRRATSCTPAPAAFEAALNTVNVGKFNLGFASIGICEHAFYEAITHADNRVLYGKRVTEFPHVRQILTDAYARLVAMKLFGARAIDYLRVAPAATTAATCSTTRSRR